MASMAATSSSQNDKILGSICNERPALKQAASVKDGLRASSSVRSPTAVRAPPRSSQSQHRPEPTTHHLVRLRQESKAVP
jgi:hypothetical protein